MCLVGTKICTLYELSTVAIRSAREAFSAIFSFSLSRVRLLSVMRRWACHGHKKEMHRNASATRW